MKKKTAHAHIHIHTPGHLMFSPLNIQMLISSKQFTDLYKHFHLLFLIRALSFQDAHTCAHTHSQPVSQQRQRLCHAAAEGAVPRWQSPGGSYYLVPTLHTDTHTLTHAEHTQHYSVFSNSIPASLQSTPPSALCRFMFHTSCFPTETM